MKVKYVADPVYKRGDKWGYIELVTDYCFFIDNKSFWINAGYQCDGASIPRIFWSIIGSPFDPEKVPAAFAHDALYLTHAVTRAVADEVLFQLLLQGGCRLRTARTMWAAVRTFAYPAWTNNAQDKQDLAEARGMIGVRPDRDKFTSLWVTQAA